MLVFLLSIACPENRDQIEEIYRKYHIEMYKIAKHKLRHNPNSALEAEEALQNAFVKIIEHFDSIRPDASERALHAYFLAIVTNEAINILNKHTEQISIHEVDDILASEDSFIDQLCLQSDYDTLVRAITELDDRYSIPMQLRFVEQMSVAEIAALLNMNVKTVYTNLSRGKKRLLELLNERGLVYEEDE